MTATDNVLHLKSIEFIKIIFLQKYIKYFMINIINKI